MFEEISGAVKYLIVALLSIIGWNVRRQIQRVDEIEDNYVGKEHIEGIKHVITDGIGEVRADVKAVHQRIDKILMNQANRREGD